MRGRLRGPYRPLQVTGVWAAVLPNARKSLLLDAFIERAGRLPIPARIDLAVSGERLHANTNLYERRDRRSVLDYAVNADYRTNCFTLRRMNPMP